MMPLHYISVPLVTQCSIILMTLLSRKIDAYELYNYILTEHSHTWMPPHD